MTDAQYTLGQLATVDDPPSFAVINGRTIYLTQEIFDRYSDWIVTGETYDASGYSVYEIEPV